MKKLFLLPILLLSLISTSCWSVDWDNLKYRDGLYYRNFTDTPFTGEVSGRHQGKMKNGKKESEWIYHYLNGRLQAKGSYKNGKSEGKRVTYYDNDQLHQKR